ncbi:MAG: radical SAM protein [Chloroflexota bacterium]
MISISRLLCDAAGPGDHLRYQKQAVPRPIVVWNYTRACNLRCLHCYASATGEQSPGEMDTAEGKRFIDDLVDFGVPVLLFSGGEPLLRKDFFELAGYAREKGLRLTLSTNGTLITEKVAKRLKDLSFAEAGISLDGTEPLNDRFRGKKGAYRAALGGMRNCIAEGLRVSLRLTVTRLNYQEIPAIFQLTADEAIHRICFYHLAYSGRAEGIRDKDLSHDQTRAVMDTICEGTLDLYRRGLPKEVLTVGNHADGVYLYLKEKQRDPARAAHIFELLKINGGNNSGIMISAVDEVGNVHPDQFWRSYSLGNIRQRKFGEIWQDTTEPLLGGLRNRRERLKGRCGDCHYVALCNGNLRERAEAVYHDVWAADPACYLSDEEIGIAK